MSARSSSLALALVLLTSGFFVRGGRDGGDEADAVSAFVAGIVSFRVIDDDDDDDCGPCNSRKVDPPNVFLNSCTLAVFQT